MKSMTLRELALADPEFKLEVSHLAELLGVSVSTGARLIKTGVIHGFEVGGGYRTTASSVRSYFERINPEFWVEFLGNYARDLAADIEAERNRIEERQESEKDYRDYEAEMWLDDWTRDLVRLEAEIGKVRDAIDHQNKIDPVMRALRARYELTKRLHWSEKETQDWIDRVFETFAAEDKAKEKKEEEK